MRKLYFAGRLESHFAIMGLNVFARCGSEFRLPAIEKFERKDKASLENYTVIIPFSEVFASKESIAYWWDKISSISKDLNCERGRLVFDYSNEGFSPSHVDNLSEFLSSCSIINFNSIKLISQSRNISSKNSKMHHLCFDVFIVLCWEECRRLLRLEGFDRINENQFQTYSVPEHDILSLNATPRLHRLVAMLTLIDQGLLDVSQLRPYGKNRIPYISYPGIEYQKSDHTTWTSIDRLARYLKSTGNKNLLRHLSHFLSICPLVVDETSLQGNQLALAIDVKPYLKTYISIVTETNLDSAVLRITEKTFKPLALGHPFVTIGCKGSLEIARSLGYSIFDEIIDQSYDSIVHDGIRLNGAIISARRYLEKVKSDPILFKQAKSIGYDNITWTINGFCDHYIKEYVKPMILEILYHP